LLPFLHFTQQLHATATSTTSHSETPTVTAPLLDGIAGMATIKQALVESILWPRLHQATYRHYGIHSSGSGLLLFGPPGSE